MNPDLKSAQEDLAFMRALVAPRDDSQAPFGWSYMAGGLTYGAQVVGHYGQTLGWYPSSGPAALLLGLGPTVVFLALLALIMVRNRSRPQGGAIGRATGLMFGSVGTATLAMLAILGLLAWRQQSLVIWLIYPCVVFVLQGLVWLVVGALRRRPWMGAVGLLWYVDAIAMSVMIGQPGYMLAAAAGLFGLMAGSGAVLVVLARRARAA